MILLIKGHSRNFLLPFDSQGVTGLGAGKWTFKLRDKILNARPMSWIFLKKISEIWLWIIGRGLFLSKVLHSLFLCNFIFENLKPLSAKLIKWPNTLKQFAGNLPTNCLSVFGHFVRLALKGLKAYNLDTTENISQVNILQI